MSDERSATGNAKGDGYKILLVEDEPHLAEGIKLNFELAGHEVKVAREGGEALALWMNWPADLIVLDLMLPGIDGKTVLKRIRQNNEKIPILILSAKSAVKDRIHLLSLGADDFLTKPFHLEELILRVQGLLKKSQWYHPSTRSDDLYEFEDIVINFSEFWASKSQQKITLTEQEIKLLKVFIDYRGQILTRQDLLILAWGYAEETSSRTVDNFLVRFRKYFEPDPKRPIYFKSVRSKGYVFNHLENL